MEHRQLVSRLLNYTWNNFSNSFGVGGEGKEEADVGVLVTVVFVLVAVAEVAVDEWECKKKTTTKTIHTPQMNFSLEIL